MTNVKTLRFYRQQWDLESTSRTRVSWCTHRCLNNAVPVAQPHPSSYIALWMVMRHGPHGWSCGFKHVTPWEKNNKRALPINFRNYPNFGCGKKRGPISLASRVAHLLRKHFWILREGVGTVPMNWFCFRGDLGSTTSRHHTAREKSSEKKRKERKVFD